MPRSSLLAVGLAVVCALTACRGVTTSFSYPDDLSHSNYVKRSKAAREFAVRRDAAQLPAAFDLLLDDEAHIRAIAYPAIRDLSGGKDFGYRPYLASTARYGIVSRWSAWWTNREAAPADAAPAVAPADEPTEVVETVPAAGEASGG